MNWSDEQYAFAKRRAQRNRQKIERKILCFKIPWTNWFAMAHKFVFCLHFLCNLLKWASNIVRIHFFFFSPSFLLSILFILLQITAHVRADGPIRMILCVIYGCDGATLVCEAIAGPWVNIITRKNRWSQLHRQSAADKIHSMWMRNTMHWKNYKVRVC